MNSAVSGKVQCAVPFPKESESLTIKLDLIQRIDCTLKKHKICMAIFCNYIKRKLQCLLKGTIRRNQVCDYVMIKRMLSQNIKKEFLNYW